MRDKVSEGHRVGVVIEVRGANVELFINGRKKELRDGEYIFTEDDFVNPHAAGYEKLHQKVAAMLIETKVPLDALLRHIANSSLIRIAHLEQSLKIPRYIGRRIIAEFIEADACFSSNGAMRKTQEYFGVLGEYLKTRSTLVQRKLKYQLPLEYGDYDPTTNSLPLEAMSLEMVMEELRSAEQVGAEQREKEILAKWLRIKQKERRAKEGNRSELEMLKQAGRDIEKESAQERARDRAQGGDGDGEDRYSDEGLDEEEAETTAVNRQEKKKTEKKKKHTKKKGTRK